MQATRCTEGNLLGLPAPACSRMGFKRWFLVDITQHGEQGYILE